MNGDEIQEENLPVNVDSPLPVDIDGALEWWNAYQELTDKLLDESDYQVTSDGTFKKKSAWRKYMTAFNISIEIINKELIRDENGRIVTAEYEVKATAPNGRNLPGVGACSIWDKAHEYDKVNKKGQVTCKGPCDGRKHFTHPEHDIPTTAYTRAVNRAISDMIGAGEVSAEEISTTNNQSQKKTSGRKQTIQTRQRPGTNLKDHMKDKKPAPPKSDPTEDEVNNIVDAEFKKKPKPAKKDKAQQVNMAPINVQELKGINDEFDKWINTVEDLEVTQDEAYNMAYELLGEQKLTPDDMKKVEETLGMDVK